MDENLYDDCDELDANDIITHCYQRRDSIYRLVPGALVHADIEENNRSSLKNQPIAIIINCSHLLGLDASAMDVLEQIAIHCKQQNCSLIFASIKANHFRVLKRTKLFDSPFPMTKNNYNNNIKSSSSACPRVGYTIAMNDALQIVEDQLLEHASLPAEEQDDLADLLDDPMPFVDEEKDKNGVHTDFYRCLQIIQNKLSVTIDIDDLMKLSSDCIPLHFKRGEAIQVHLGDLVNLESVGRSPASLPQVVSQQDLTDPHTPESDSPSVEKRRYSGKQYSKKSLAKNVRGLFFLYKGYVTCEGSKGAGEEMEPHAMVPKGRKFTFQSFFQASSVSIDEQIRRLELSEATKHENGTGGQGGRELREGASQHGPGWVFGRLRECIHEGKYDCLYG